MQARVLCPAIFSPHIACFRIYCLNGFVLDFLFSFTEITVTVCVRAQAAILHSSAHLVKAIAKLFEKTERWVNKWSKRKSFEGKPRSGRPSVLTNYGRNNTTKAKYKHNNSKRKIAQKVQHHNINVSSTKIWSLTNKGWKAFKRKKIPLLSEKQRRPRLKFSRKYSKLTAEDWENFKRDFNVCFHFPLISVGIALNIRETEH